VGGLDGVLAAADRNMVALWTELLRRGPRPGRAVDGDLTMLSSGLPVPLFNPAFCFSPPADPAAVVATVVDHYRALASPFAFYFRDEVAPSLADACEAGGLVEHFRPPLMLLDPVPPGGSLPAPPADLELVAVDGGTVADAAGGLARGFGMPAAIADGLFDATMVVVDGFAAVLGLVDGEPATTAAAYVTDGMAGIYNVATVPEQRGHGYGEAATWAAVAAGARLGGTRAILQASGAGEPVYARMGFTTPDRYRQFEAPS
jgi:hypothetical protein